MARILVLGNHPESLISFRKDMLQALAINNQVIVCVPNASASIIRELDIMGVEYKNVQLARTSLNPFYDIKLLYNLYKLFKYLQPDQVFTYTSKPIIFGTYAARLAGIKQNFAMITGLGSYFIYNDLKSRCVRSIMQLMYKLALKFNTKVFFQNRDDVADFRKFKIFNDPARTVMINGSGVNLKYFPVLPLPDATIRFLMVARFIRAKGIYEYLAAAREIKQQYPQVEFLLVGWQDNKSEALDTMVLQTYLDDNTVKNLGKLSDVRPALAQASIFVLPSYREGTPKSVLEAMATGRAIITTDVPGCRETVTDGDNGFLIPAQNVAALRGAMEKFILNPSLIAQMGQRSREVATSKFDVNIVNNIILTAMERQHVALV